MPPADAELPANHGKPWSEEDEKKLSWDWGTIPLTQLAARFKRSGYAVFRKAIDMGLGRAKRGTMSVNAFSKYSGFSVFKIMKAARALDLNLWRGLSSEPGRDRVRDYDVKDFQQEALIKYMMDNPWIPSPGSSMSKQGEWGTGRKPAACLRCNRSDKPHFSKGKCRGCYNAQYKVRSGVRFSDLTTEKVVAMREAYASGVTQPKLALQYSVSKSTVSKIIRGEYWAKAGGPINKRARKGSHGRVGRDMASSTPAANGGSNDLELRGVAGGLAGGEIRDEATARTGEGLGPVRADPHVETGRDVDPEEGDPQR